MRLLVALCDWDVAALARAALTLGAAALERGGGHAALGPRLAAARTFVDCPCHAHARALLEAAGARSSGPPPPERDAVDQACFLAFRAHDARYTSELEALAGLLVGSACALGLDVALLDAAVRRELAPWAVGRARTVAALAEELGAVED